MKLWDIVLIIICLLIRSAQFSTRSTLLCTEALKSKGLYSEAAVQFVKMTSEVGTSM